MKSDFEIIASTVEDNMGKLEIIASALVDGSLTDEASVISAYNSIVAAQQNANTMYGQLVSAVDSVPFMVAASADNDVFGNTVRACQELAYKADTLLNVIVAEHGIEVEDDEPAEDAAVELTDDEEEEDEDDGEDFEDTDDETQQVVSSELKKASVNKVAASEKPATTSSLFDFING